MFGSEDVSQTETDGPKEKQTRTHQSNTPSQSVSSVLPENDLPIRASGQKMLHGILPHHTFRQAAAVNPAARPALDAPLTYLEAFGAEITTATSAQQHETRIYQPGYTPGEIRSNIKLILRTISPQQHMLDFPSRDIPPKHMDPRTHMVLHALHAERERLASAMTACIQGIADSEAPAYPSRDMETEYSQLDKAHNDANRSMYQVYSDGPFIIHDNNFQTYCKPHLRNLPESTAFELQEIRNKMGIQDDPLPAPTVPQFRTPLDKPSRHIPLQPRAQWMRDTPPFMTDEEADDTYNKACDGLFGAQRPSLHEQRLPVGRDHTASDSPMDIRHLNSSRGTSSAREVSAAVRQRVHEQQHQESSSSTDPVQPARRPSTRAQPPKRIRYDPQAMGQGPKDVSGFSTTNPILGKTQHLVVDTGASHVLFRQEDSHCLSHVQFSPPCSSPFAILSAANGAALNAIGRGMFTVGTVTIVAFIFRDTDLIHNLMGIAPFADLGCTATFTAKRFTLTHLGNDPILIGTRHTSNLWRIPIPRQNSKLVPDYGANQVTLLHQTAIPEAEHIRFVHASLGHPTPTTFLTAVARGFINDVTQFPRLTTKNVRRHMPNSEASARGHLRKTPTAQPHAGSDAVSALHRYHKAEVIKELKRKHLSNNLGSLYPPFNPTTVTKSTTLHLDYTGAWPERGSMGTSHLEISTWGSYIHITPLTGLKGAQTAESLTKTLSFFREKGVVIDSLRVDNQSSPEFRAAAKSVQIISDLVSANQKEPNRAERAIQTAKHHILASRAGFHRDCSTTLLDRCLPQIEITLNTLHPYEYDPRISAYHGLYGRKYDFMRHPIAPIGSKVLTWDPPDKRGSWADHGTAGIYVGPALHHFRAFRIWIPQTSALRISATVWWFFATCLPDENILKLQDQNVSFPPTRDRPHPQTNGSDLLGRFFLEPELGVCCITRLGPVTRKQMPSRAQLHALSNGTKAIAIGNHHTLYYQCVKSREEFFSSVDEIVQWIATGPILQPPATNTRPSLHTTTPSYEPEQDNPTSLHDPLRVLTQAPQDHPPLPDRRHDETISAPPSEVTPKQITPEAISQPQTTGEAERPVRLNIESRRTSTRKRVPRDLLRPTHHGKAYAVKEHDKLRRKQRVPITLTYPEKQRVSQLEHRCGLYSMALDPNAVAYRRIFHRYQTNVLDKRDRRIGLHPELVPKRQKTNVFSANGVYDTPMPKPDLPPVFLKRPLNLNEDGSSITYRKSHEGPHSAYWQQADAEEIERLFTSGTLRPLFFKDIPAGKRATYVNPVCSERLRDTGAVKFRTRATIGGDQINYPFNTTAVTANLECIKILLNAMISDDINLATMDLEDFYLGTPLPHPEYIRIPARFIPAKVMDFYKLKEYMHHDALYCAVLKTHYGLPQAGALSQERLFHHLEKHGYRQLCHSQALFRNHDGSIRFALVVDDFAVIWKKKTSIDHFIATLRKLYTVKIDWEGSKYLGMTISINRPDRYVTISMPGYIEKLLRKVRPNGIKGASTPGIYIPPNYKSPKAQTATIDLSPLATAEQQHELQVVVGTLLYYARTVDPSILTAIHELGSVQSKPTIQDMRKVDRVLQYVSTHQNGATRFYASTMQHQVQSDASFLCRPKARSVLGGYHYLGFLNRLNGPIYCTSKIISCVVASVAEAELGAAFQNAQRAAEFRNTLHELGYPQQPTTIMIDNTVAEGLAADTINAKRSKSMDVRFFWLRDRIKKGQFAAKHLAGRWNIADFFTKSLPREKFSQFAPYVVINLDKEPLSKKRKITTITLVKKP